MLFDDVPEDPQVTVVTLAFNQGEFLDACLQSIYSQDFEDFEHIIVEPGSTDTTNVVLAARPHKSQRILRIPDRSPAEGLNNGFEHSRGGILLYLNADDELAPGAIRAIVDAHQERPEAGVVIGNGYLIDRVGQPIRAELSDKFTFPRVGMNIGNVLQQATSYKRSHLARRPFNENNRFTWDFELLCDLASAGVEMANISHQLAYFRVYDASISNSASGKIDMARSRREVLRRHLTGTRAVAFRSCEPLARSYKWLTTAGTRRSTPFPGRTWRLPASPPSRPGETRI